MRSISIVSLCLLFATAACGDDKKAPGRPDAREFPDAPVDIDAQMPIDCVYNEMSDATNDDLIGNGTAEASGISFGTAGTAICGKINNGHYNNPNDNVDVDSYTFTVPTQTRGILYAGGTGLETFDSVVIQINGVTTMVSEYGPFEGTVGVVAADLPPGDYVITIAAYDPADIAAAIDYKLTLRLDPATRCAKSTATASFTEALEQATGGATGGANDVYEIRYSNNSRSLTALPTDMPEATGVTVEPAMSYRVTGTSSTFTATPLSWMDSFQDRDTYAVTIGATTNQLAIRLNWGGTNHDFDMFVFKLDGANPGLLEKSVGWDGANMEDEFTTLAVTPGAAYWIVVAADDTSTGQPVPYDLTFCGDAVTP
jgi:hypothetical protein